MRPTTLQTEDISINNNSNYSHSMDIIEKLG